jgi:hypothetical protein
MDCQGQLVEQQLGKHTLWSCIALSSLLSHPGVFMIESNRQCIFQQLQAFT